jgi:hypothetical protein
LLGLKILDLSADRKKRLEFLVPKLR